MCEEVLCWEGRVRVGAGDGGNGVHGPGTSELVINVV